MPQDVAIGRNPGIGYRYKITKKDGSIRYATDNYATIDVENSRDAMNIIKLWAGCMIDSKPGTMTHRFLDSDSIILPSGSLDNGIKNPRNHFNVYGGSMKGLIELIKSGEFDPYRYVITNPDLGNDRMSSHRYWPCNLYQCSNIKDFKDVNWELFIRGKGYVADGAFTSQGIESPMFQHVLKWGEESPFFNMFKLDDPQGVIKLGILPDHDIGSDVDEFSHLGIRIVNNPYDKDNYDIEKPVYIQFYDDRMVSQEVIQDTTSLIEKYDKQPEDIFEISSYDDSMYPYYFELNPEAINYKYMDKIAAFKDRDFMSLNDLDENFGLDDFLNFGKFAITSRNRAGGATFWDGNRDIVKLNLTNAHNNAGVEYAQQNRDGMKKARNYVFGAAEYWSEAVQGDLILRLANVIQTKSSILDDILSKNDIEKTDELFNVEDKTYPTIEEDKKLDEYILKFPLQSMETSPELSAIFAQSDFNQLLLQYNDFVENYEIGADNYIYKNGNKVDFSELNPPDFNMFVSVYIMANEIVDNIVNSVTERTADNKGEYRAYILKTYANDIIKCIYAQALNPDAVEGGKINNVELNSVGLRAIMREQTQPLSSDASSPSHEKEAVIRKIQKGLKNVDYNAIEDRIRKEVQYIDLEDFKNAETIVLQAKAGLNWRFDAAKDIGDMDAVKSGTKRFRDVWDEKDGVVDFWNKFIDKARKYNPSAYVIAEITDLWSLFNMAPHKDFDIDENNPDVKEKDFLHKINASTSSDYSNFFNKLSCFVGVNPEKLNDDNNHPLSRSGNLEELYGNYLGFLKGNQAHNANLTHLFFENHDKPRALHSMPLDMEMFL